MSDFFTKFLNQGSFLRRSSDEVHLWTGDLTREPRVSSHRSASVGLCPFWSQSLEFHSFSEHRILTAQEVHRELEPFLAPLKVKKGEFTQPERAKMASAFQATQGRIQRGELDKAVIIGSSTVSWSPERGERAALVARALMGLPSSYPYGFWTAQNHGFIGVTPEILFERKGVDLRTMALAGSCPKEEVSQRAPLLKDPKEMREHQMVVKDISDRLRQQGWLSVEETEVVELPTLVHLKTEILLKQCKKSDEELVQLLHPTAAMAQFPRNYGLNWMKELPYQSERGQHGGVIWFSVAPEQTLALVSIRSLFWDSGKSWITAGCGVVAESQEEREWNEMLAKIDSVHKALGLV